MNRNKFLVFNKKYKVVIKNLYKDDRGKKQVYPISLIFEISANMQ